MDISTKLNAKQLEAASSDSQYLRIIAGAGTGKTRTLSYRIAYLIDQGMQPKRIVAITFTNKAAREMEERVSSILANESDTPFVGKPLVSTFHGFCYRFLKKEIHHIDGYDNQFAVADTTDQNTIFKQIFKNMIKGQSKEFVSAIVSKISSLKNDGKEVKDVHLSDVPLGSIYSYDELMHVYTEYQKYMRLQNFLDFDDLLILTNRIMRENEAVRLTWQSKYDIFLVDEFQDTNVIQYELVRLFMRKESMGDRGTRLTVVGDPDQTIYTWRGAKNEIIKDSLQRSFPTLETVVLDDNYRSTQSILNAANALIKNNRDRIAKDLNAANGIKGEDVHYTNYANSDNEGYAIASAIHSLVTHGKCDYDDIAIIYRANYLSNAIEKQLANFKIPYQVYGGLKFFERAEIKDALSYLRLIINPDDISFQRVLNAPSKGIGDVMLAKARGLKSSLGDEVSLFTIFHDYQEELKLPSNARFALNRFFTAYQEMEDLYLTNPTNDELLTGIKRYFDASGFSDYVAKEDKKAQDKTSYTASSSTSKVDNLNEFLRSLTSALDSPVVDEDGNIQDSTLEDFLISVALQSDQDTMKDAKQVALMTGHVSKGLEFPYVFVTGVNQTIFPTQHALMGDGNASIEEERRLFYVCVTRAQKVLYVSSFGGHNFRNGMEYLPSMFIRELNLVSLKQTTTRPQNKNSSNNYYASIGQHRPTKAVPQNTIFSASNLNKLRNMGASNSPSDTYAIGDKIVHTSFGKGEVVALDGNTKIIVRFGGDIGEKKLMVGFKAFRKLKDGEE